MSATLPPSAPSDAPPKARTSPPPRRSPSPSRAVGSRLRAYPLSLTSDHPTKASTIHSREEPDPDPEETDDGASVAESFVSNTKIRRTEAERIEYFRNQPECGEIEPHRAFCTRCNKHVGLGKKQTYTVRPWETHRAKCDQKLPVSMM